VEQASYLFVRSQARCLFHKVTDYSVHSQKNYNVVFLIGFNLFSKSQRVKSLQLMGKHSEELQLFDAAFAKGFHGIDHQFYETQDKGHGRLETRRYWLMGQTQYLIGAELWDG
jgi:hypothetical protein